MTTDLRDQLKDALGSTYTLERELGGALVFCHALTTRPDLCVFQLQDPRPRSRMTGLELLIAASVGAPVAVLVRSVA